MICRGVFWIRIGNSKPNPLEEPKKTVKQSANSFKLGEHYNKMGRLKHCPIEALIEKERIMLKNFIKVGSGTLLLVLCCLATQPLLAAQAPKVQNVEEVGKALYNLSQYEIEGFLLINRCKAGLNNQKLKIVKAFEKALASTFFSEGRPRKEVEYVLQKNREVHKKVQSLV